MQLWTLRWPDQFGMSQVMLCSTNVSNLPAERSHLLLGIPRRKMARCYGPARILALETKMTYQGHARQPSGIAWIIASGRLKKVACNQLRHASEREGLVAEGTTQVTTPWTFQDPSGLIPKGEYDDEILTEKQFRKEAQKIRQDWEEDFGSRTGQKRQLPDELPEASPTG